MSDRLERSRRCGLASHRLIGWIYWDPTAIANHTALGIPNGFGYYIASRGASLADAGNGAVTAAFYSIHPAFVAVCLDAVRSVTTFAEVAAARDRAVVAGLREHVPEICDGLGELADPLWAAADTLPMAGRALFASLRDRPRPDDPLLAAWLAVNCIREWRGDTHWALHVAADLDAIEAGVLDGAWRNYDADWLPRSRGADDAALASAYRRLEAKGFATDGTVDERGLAARQALEDRLDELCTPGWDALGDSACTRFLELVEPVGPRLVERIDLTAGPNWMPAARDRDGSERGR